MGSTDSYANVTPATGTQFLVTKGGATKNVLYEDLIEALVDLLAGSTLVAGANITITYNDAAGTITIAGSASGAPTTATYIVQTADAGLSAEQALAALATGLLKNTTATGVLSIATPDTPGGDYVTPIPRGRGKTGGAANLSLPGVAVSGHSGSIGTFVLTAAFIHYMPIWVDTTITLDQLAAQVTTPAGAGNKMRMGIYNADTDWKATSLVVDAGEVAIDAGAVVTATINQQLQRGRYLLASLPQANVTVRTVLGTIQELGFNPSLGTNAFVNELYASQSYGALPGTGPAWSQGVSSIGMQYHVWGRISAP